jgi:glycosyltransferase involved in cell wall biosynthesis
MKKTVLLVPGFMADTYYSEEWYVELCRSKYRDVEFLWLVPEVSSLFRDKRYWHSDSPSRLTEPLYVTHLRRNKTPIVVGDIRKYNLVANFLLFRKLFTHHAIDAVYTQFGIERFWATLFGKLWGKTTIWSEHWHSLGMRYGTAKRFFYLLFVDYFIAGSKFIAATLPKADKVYTVPNCIRVQDEQIVRDDQQRRRQRQQLGLPEAALVVLMVANFTQQKRHSLALQICREVLKKRTDVVFVFLSDGPERQRIIEEIEKLNLAPHFFLPGYVSELSVDEYYTIADISMFTAFNDAAPLAVLEAMKHALPLIAFDSGGPKEFIKHGTTGFVVAEGDIVGFAEKVLELAENRQKRTTMGREAYQVILRDYSLASWKDRVMSVLREILFNRG